LIATASLTVKTMLALLDVAATEVAVMVTLQLPGRDAGGL